MSLYDDYEPEPPRKYSLCPKCFGELVLREGKYGSFYGCKNYPKCNFTCSEEEFDEHHQKGKK